MKITRSKQRKEMNNLKLNRHLIYGLLQTLLTSNEQTDLIRAQKFFFCNPIRFHFCFCRCIIIVFVYFLWNEPFNHSNELNVDDYILFKSSITSKRQRRKCTKKSIQFYFVDVFPSGKNTCLFEHVKNLATLAEQRMNFRASMSLIRLC